MAARKGKPWTGTFRRCGVGEEDVLVHMKSGVEGIGAVAS